MNLGENIYRLRTEKNLSQGDLADALDVSRQSVSKWENNSAVPELDKLIKMAEVFGVSLDALVRNPVAQDPSASESPSAPTDALERKDIPESSGTVAGFIFLVVAAALFILRAQEVNFSTGILYAAPLLICSALCFILKRRRGLWCCWVLLFSAVTWTYGGTGIGLQAFWLYLLTFLDSPTQLYYFLITLAINIAICGMGFWTFRSYIMVAVSFVSTKMPRLLMGWMLTFIPDILTNILYSLMIRVSAQGQQGLTYRLLRWMVYSMNWLHLAAVLIMVILSAALLRRTLVRKSVATRK